MTRVRGFGLDHEDRVAIGSRQKRAKVIPREGDAALGGLKGLRRRVGLSGLSVRGFGAVQENRAAKARASGGALGRVIIVAQHHQQIIKPIRALHHFMPSGVGPTHGPVIGGILRRVAPPIVRANGASRQRGLRCSDAISPIQGAPQWPGAQRRGAVAFALIRCRDDAAAPEHTRRGARAVIGHEGQDAAAWIVR